jgi:hypothetical protein
MTIESIGYDLTFPIGMSLWQDDNLCLTTSHWPTRVPSRDSTFGMLRARKFGRTRPISTTVLFYINFLGAFRQDSTKLRLWLNSCSQYISILYEMGLGQLKNIERWQSFPYTTLMMPHFGAAIGIGECRPSQTAKAKYPIPIAEESIQSDYESKLIVV